MLRLLLPWDADPGIADPAIDEMVLLAGSPTWTESSDHPRLTVCTNGRRDLCCAERGRALLDELPAHLSGQVWECTHLGGHRFSPTGLVIPEGFVFGRITAADLSALMEHGLARPENLRGRSDLHQMQQVAELVMRRDLALVSLSDQIQVFEPVETIHGASVDTQHQGREHRVHLRREALPAVPSSCGRDPEPEVVWVPA